MTFVYELPAGKITTAGTAELSATGPIFDEQFAITGGTSRYQSARGQVRVVQQTVEQAKVTFRIELCTCLTAGHNAGRTPSVPPVSSAIRDGREWNCDPPAPPTERRRS